MTSFEYPIGFQLSQFGRIYHPLLPIIETTVAAVEQAWLNKIWV